MVEVTPYRRPAEGTQPPYRHDAYVSTQKRSPSQPPIAIAQTLSEVTGPRFDRARVSGYDDLTRVDGGAAIGERIVVSGRVLDEDGQSIRNTLIELWQANAAGRYVHSRDTHDAPLDPHFAGEGTIASRALAVLLLRLRIRSCEPSVTAFSERGRSSGPPLAGRAARHRRRP